MLKVRRIEALRIKTIRIKNIFIRIKPWHLKVRQPMGGANDVLRHTSQAGGGIDLDGTSTSDGRSLRTVARTYALKLLNDCCNRQPPLSLSSPCLHAASTFAPPCSESRAASTDLQSTATRCCRMSSSFTVQHSIPLRLFQSNPSEITMKKLRCNTAALRLKIRNTGSMCNKIGLAKSATCVFYTHPCASQGPCRSDWFAHAT
eukprot:6207070-Pleurochrysis_carterae.AAC.4